MPHAVLKDLELLNPLPVEATITFYAELGFEPGASCMLYEHSTN